MRVLHIITGLHAGGAEQQLHLLLRHTRHTCEVVSLTDIGSVGQRMLEDGITVHALGMGGNRDLTALPGLVRLIRRGGFDVVHVHLYRACIYGRIAARIAGVPVVVATEHSLGDTHLEGRVVTGSVRRLYLATARLGDHTIAVSPTVERRLTDLGLPGGEVTTIPNGVDADAMGFDARARAEVRREFGIAPDVTVIGSVGRLHHVKGFDTLIEAASGPLRQGARLLLVGEGPERHRLRGLAREHGVDAQLLLPGERSDVARLLAAMDVYAAPSRDETFGLAVLEALAAGLPVVVGRCPALDGIALPQVRRVTGPEDLDRALREAVDAAPGDGDRCPPEVLRARFDVRAMARRIDDLHHRLDRRAATGTERGSSRTAVEVVADVTSVASEWEALAQRSGASPFVRPGWILAWQRYFGEGPLRVLAARRDGRLVGVWPLRSAHRRVSSPTNYETPIFGMVAVDLDAARALAEDLLARRPRSVDLSYVQVGSVTEQAIRQAAAARGYLLVHRAQLRSPHIDLTVGWATYEKRFSSTRRKSFRRSRRQLEKYGEVAFEVVRGGPRLREVLEECFRVEASGWKGRAGTALAERPAARGFYTEVARAAAADGTLLITCLRVGGRVAAFELALEQRDTLYGLKVAYDDEFRKGSPGIVLTREVVERAFASGRSQYDWLGSDEPWKSVWTDGYHERSRLLLLAPTPGNRAMRWSADHADVLPEPLVRGAKALARRRLGR